MLKRGHSDRKDFGGFDEAALMTRKFTIVNVNTTAPATVTAKIHHDIVA